MNPDYSYASTQKTNCAGCGQIKHTPLRRDEMGGYVCLTCIDKALDAKETEAHADKRRLDFLDECNRRLNEKCGNFYGWELILSHNVTRLMMESPFVTERAGVDLHDSQVPAQAKKTCREAIDAVMQSESLKKS